MAQVLEGEAGEVPEGGVFVGGQGRGAMWGVMVGLGPNRQPMGAGDQEGFLVVWVELESLPFSFLSHQKEIRQSVSSF